MKRRDLIRHLTKNGCVLVREGSKHSIYASAKTGMWTTVPRHTEIKNPVAAAICRALGVPLP
jgi:mRNA interferase HicA